MNAVIGEPLTALSMGWGVQTWTLAAMMALAPQEETDINCEGGYCFT